MRYLIVGCGRVGSALAKLLDADGHEVIVVDENPAAFKRLGQKFKGHEVVGTGIDYDVLKRAGAATADGFIAVTNGDNRNIMAALIAQRMFKIKRIVARIYDPPRGQMYRELGVQTVCPTTVGAKLIRDVLIKAPWETQTFDLGKLTSVSTFVRAADAGKRVGEIEDAGKNPHRRGPPRRAQRHGRVGRPRASRGRRDQRDRRAGCDQRLRETLLRQRHATQGLGVAMFILIVGGGKVGSYLSRALLNQGHELVVIEKDERKAKMLERLIDRHVTVVGDGCDPLVLDAAGVARADVVVADTGDDEDNLVVVLLSKRKSKARCIARVNNPANKLIFNSLDSDDPVIVISSTELILDVLNEHVNASKYRSMLETMHLFGKGDMQLVKVAIPERSPVDGKRLAEIDFPHNSVVVAVDRPNHDLEIPTGDTTLRAGDAMIVIVKNGAAERIRAILGA